MKWNDAWLSDVDADGDGLLDRHLGFDSYIGSGAWLTNHMSGEYAADGTEIGPEIWGAFAIIQQVENDGCAGLHGLQCVSPHTAGLGSGML